MSAEAKPEQVGDTTGQKTQSRPSNLCCYSQRVCNLEKLKGFDFCHKHILEDKASPFKPCDFYAKTNERRCMNPAPKLTDKEKSYCLIHTRKAELRRVVEKRKKKRHRDNSNTIEEGESNTIGKRKRTSSSASYKSVDESHKDDEGQTSDEDMSAELGVGGSQKVDSAWHGDVDSDAESVDSEEEDHLRHAEIWTLDEVSKMCCDKMSRLKSLYMAQYKRLFHVLKEKRRKYLQLVQAEQENQGEKHICSSEILGTSSQSRKHGVEALLHKQAKEKRHGLTPRHQSSLHQRCTHVSDGTRCANKILPLTKFCIHHISHDPNQLLFQSCSFKAGDDKTCSNVVPKIFSYTTCQLHMTLTAEPTRTNVHKDLEEATKRDQERIATEEAQKDSKVFIKPFPDVSEMTMQDKQMPIPKALQQKSSALVPPPPPILTTETKISISDISSKEPLPSYSKHHSIPDLKIEKMDIDQTTPSESTESTPRELMSPVSGTSTPAGVKSISPTLLAASLVAVCSAVPTVSVTPAQTTTTSEISKESTSTSAAIPKEYVPLVVSSQNVPTIRETVSQGVTSLTTTSTTCTTTSTAVSSLSSHSSSLVTQVDNSRGNETSSENTSSQHGSNMESASTDTPDCNEVGGSPLLSNNSVAESSGALQQVERSTKEAELKQTSEVSDQEQLQQQLQQQEQQLQQQTGQQEQSQQQQQIGQQEQQKLKQQSQQEQQPGKQEQQQQQPGQQEHKQLQPAQQEQKQQQPAQQEQQKQQQEL